MRFYKSVLVFLMTYLVSMFVFLSINSNLWHTINESPIIHKVENDKYLANVGTIGILNDLNLVILKVGQNLVNKEFEFFVSDENNTPNILVDYQVTWLGSAVLGLLGIFVAFSIFYFFDKKQGFYGFKQIKIFILKTSWQTFIKQSYLGIDEVYRKSFWVIFLILNLVFAYHSIQFLWGNHEWYFLENGITPWWQSFAGRFSGGFAHQILGGRVLPLLGNMLSLCGIALAGILLAIYWKIPKSIYNVVVIGLFIGVCPYILSWFYFLINTPLLLWTPTLIVGAFLLGDRTNTVNMWFYSFVSVLLLLIALGGHAASINAIGVILLFKILLEYYFGKSLKEVIIGIRFTILDIVIALLVYVITIKFLKKFGVMASGYNTQTIELTNVFSKFIEVFFASFKQFLESYPFIDLYYLQILLVLVLFALVILIIKEIKDLQKVIVAILICFLALLATKATAFVAKSDVMYASRIDWLGLLYVYVFAIAFILRINKTITNNVLLVLMIFILPMSILRDVEAQKVWKLGFDAEREVTYRLIERIETHPNYNPNNTYALVMIGDVRALRPNYYQGDKSKKDAADLLFHSYTPNWVPEQPLKFYAPNIKIQHGITISKSMLESNFFDKRIVEYYLLRFQDFIKNTAEIFPRENSIFIDNECIVVVWNPADLQLIRSMYK